MELDVNALLWFAQVVEAGQLSRAAAQLRIPPSTLSRRLAQLEKTSGVRLLERTTRQIRLTEAGRTIYEHCVHIRTEVERAGVALDQMQSTPRGAIRVATPIALGTQYLAPSLGEFLKRYPEIKVQLFLTSDKVDLVGQAFDIALRIGPTSNSSLRQRMLGRATMYFYASPRYLIDAGEPRVPADLQRHRILAQSAPPLPSEIVWTLHSRDGEEIRLDLRPTVVSNEVVALLNTATNGYGLLLATHLIAQPYVASGHLVRVLPDWMGPSLEFYVLFPSNRGLAPKVRVFVDFLAAALSRSLSGASYG